MAGLHLNGKRSRLEEDVASLLEAQIKWFQCSQTKAKKKIKTENNIFWRLRKKKKMKKALAIHEDSCKPPSSEGDSLTNFLAGYF